MTKQYRIYQKRLTDEQSKQINTSGKGWSTADWSLSYIELSVEPDDQKIIEAAEHGLFRHTATIEADDLNGVFHIGNVGPEEKITRTNIDPMASVSVGDVIVDVDNLCGHVVKSFGFGVLTDFTVKALLSNTVTRIPRAEVEGS